MSVMPLPSGKWRKQVVLVVAGGALLGAALAVGLDTWLRVEHRARSTTARTGAPAAVAPHLAPASVGQRSAPQPLLVYVVETEEVAAVMRADLERANSTRVREGALTFLVVVRTAGGSAELLDALSREAQVVPPHGQPGVVLDLTSATRW